MIQVAITGKNGQVGQALVEVAEQFHEVQLHFFDRTSWDITNFKEGQQAFEQIDFDVLINTAAYTAVDKAEDEKEECFRVNREAISTLVDLCNKNRCHLIHLSTDYVYNNNIRRPLSETDVTTPKGIYAASKKAGEMIISSTSLSATIFRTSWVYSKYGHNFVKTMLRLSEKLNAIKVVQDQWGCPTSAHDLANHILAYIIAKKPLSQGVQIFNLTEKGMTNWYEMACYIFHQTMRNVQVTPITTAAFGAKAPRPEWSVLDCEKFDQLNVSLRRHWKEALDECLLSLNENQRVGN